MSLRAGDHVTRLGQGGPTLSSQQTSGIIFSVWEAVQHECPCTQEGRAPGLTLPLPCHMTVALCLQTLCAEQGGEQSQPQSGVVRTEGTHVHPALCPSVLLGDARVRLSSCVMHVCVAAPRPQAQPCRLPGCPGPCSSAGGSCVLDQQDDGRLLDGGQPVRVTLRRSMSRKAPPRVGVAARPTGRS